MTTFDRPTEPNAECTHPRATHAHGTYACYVLDGCRCDDCRPVAVAYRREESRRRAYRQWAPDDRYEPYVDATAVREHLHALAAAGLGHKEISRRSGVAASSIGALLWPTPSRGRGIRTRVRRQTAAKLLAVTIPAPRDLRPGQKVDGIPTANRVRALARIGYSVGELCRRAGIDRQTLDRVVSGNTCTTTAGTHAIIEDLFGALWSTPFLPTDHRAKIARSRAMRRAELMGWPSPVDLDEAGYVDIEDDAVDLSEPPAAARNLDEFDFLVRSGTAPDEAAMRVGVRLSSIATAARRLGRDDVLRLITTNKAAA